MTMSIRQIVDHVASLSDLKSNGTELFLLMHEYDDNDDNNILIEAPYSHEVFATIVAYIQFICDEVDHTYGMSQEDVASILCSLYDCKIKLPHAREFYYYSKVELCENWEMFCGSYSYDKIMQNKLFEREELGNELIRMVDNR